MHLVRKVNKAKWFQIDILNNSDVTADAITNCLKTTNNTLSVWSIKEENDVNNAVLAISSGLDHIETIDVVILEKETIEKHKIKIVVSNGNTPISTFVNSHRDLSNLTFTKLGFIKDHIVERIRENKLKRFTKGTLIKMLKQAIDDGILQLIDLKESIREKIN